MYPQTTNIEVKGVGNILTGHAVHVIIQKRQLQLDC